MEITIAPSILAADFANLQSEIQLINQSAADWIHFDVMDGVFVPNISFGFPVLEAVKQHARKPIDVHLMIQDPGRYVEQFKEAGADNITVHYEACVHLHRTLEQIKQLNCRAGVAINPHTPVSVLEDIIADVDVLLIMSVNPGFGGQRFIQNTYRKVEAAKALIEARGSKAIIEIDGGVNLENAPLLIKAGANALVAGNFVFSAADPVRTISDLKKIQP